MSSCGTSAMTGRRVPEHTVCERETDRKRQRVFAYFAYFTLLCAKGQDSATSQHNQVYNISASGRGCNLFSLVLAGVRENLQFERKIH